MLLVERLNANKYVHMIFIHSKATSNPIWEQNNPKQKQMKNYL